ncbi:MAG: DUF2855 family protein [Synechococcales cyanobacterium CRU_2_2]|nr:DUF2855 family protein [Synechococcales cyanobacterium CRU_2_2]
MRPLYLTSWLCADFLRDQHLAGAAQVLVLSASSKTALAFGAALQRMQTSCALIALTAKANQSFVQASGYFDHVFAYDDLAKIPVHAAVAVDMAGSGDILRAVHQQWGTQLRYSASVGLSHRSGLNANRGGFVGLQPQLFSRPSRPRSAAQHSAPAGSKAARRAIGHTS